MPLTFGMLSAHTWVDCDHELCDELCFDAQVFGEFAGNGALLRARSSSVGHASSRRRILTMQAASRSHPWQSYYRTAAQLAEVRLEHVFRREFSLTSSTCSWPKLRWAR